MKKQIKKHKTMSLLIGGLVLLFLLFLSVKYKIDTTLILRDILYFPINIIPNSNKLELDDRCLELSLELEELKTLTNIGNTLSEFTIIPSVVVNRNASYWNNKLTINKGYIDNIKKGMAVVDNKGLIGRIESVGISTSIVKLITNYSDNNKISVSIYSNNKTINKILETDVNNNLIIQGIDNNYELNIGDRVTTSGLSDIFPSGISIGTIEKIEYDKFGTSKKAYVKHISDLDSIRFVAVLNRG